MPHETTQSAAILVGVLCTPYNHAPSHFMQSHICKVYVCLAVTCDLHFWQNDQDLLHATAVKWGWNGYRNKSQHRKSTLEKKIFLLLLLGFEPVTFQSRVWRSNHWAIPAPLSFWMLFRLNQTKCMHTCMHTYSHRHHLLFPSETSHNTSHSAAEPCTVKSLYFYLLKIVRAHTHTHARTHARTHAHTHTHTSLTHKDEK